MKLKDGNVKRDIEVGFLILSSFILGFMYKPAIQHVSRSINCPVSIEEPYRDTLLTKKKTCQVRTKLHDYVSVEYYNGRPKPEKVLCYELDNFDEGRPTGDWSRKLISTFNDGIYNEKFTRPGSKCSKCHQIIEIIEYKRNDGKGELVSY
jgi:hypothetical protein